MVQPSVSYRFQDLWCLLSIYNRAAPALKDKFRSGMLSLRLAISEDPAEKRILANYVNPNPEEGSIH